MNAGSTVTYKSLWAGEQTAKARGRESPQPSGLARKPRAGKHGIRVAEARGQCPLAAALYKRRGKM